MLSSCLKRALKVILKSNCGGKVVGLFSMADGGRGCVMLYKFFGRTFFVRLKGC
jgi:hypothetical protein